jgi:predicted murein hydrolase (TIGR00659 family)
LKDLLCDSAFFGVVVSILGYEIGLFLKKKFNNGIFNPLLISILFVMAALVIFKVDFQSYNDGAKYLSYLLTPATVCLAIPLYEQLDLLKNNFKAIIIGIFSGVAASLISVFLFALLFKFTHEQYVTLLPKSITTAIGMGISEELNGIVTITVAVIIVTGILGNILAEVICKIFNIHEPIAKGIAIGTSSHAIGTAKAMEMGEIEGAMSGLAIAVAGLFTVIGASIFANFL